MKLVVTIDTEEDNWGRFNDTDYRIENIEMIPKLQEVFDDFGIKPSYLVTYPVATHKKSVNILRNILETGKCEIGAHCHPWSTPPFEEERNERNSMLCNLNGRLQYEKIRTLHNKIRDNFGINPVSFRAGRWGYNQAVARNLSRLGYQVDTSVTAYTDWSMFGGPDFSLISPRPYRFSVDDICAKCSNGELLEVPATVGFLQKNFRLSSALYKLFSDKRLGRLKLKGVLRRLNLLNKVDLSPETSDLREMKSLTRVLKKNGHKLLNLYFHSPSLKAGVSPFVKTQEDEDSFFQKISDFFRFVNEVNIESIKLSDCLKLQL